jgi:hypothetical protein
MHGDRVIVLSSSCLVLPCFQTRVDQNSATFYYTVPQTPLESNYLSFSYTKKLRRHIAGKNCASEVFQRLYQFSTFSYRSALSNPRYAIKLLFPPLPPIVAVPIPALPFYMRCKWREERPPCSFAIKSAHRQSHKRVTSGCSRIRCFINNEDRRHSKAPRTIFRR